MHRESFVDLVKLGIPFIQVNFCWGGFFNSHPVRVTFEAKFGWEFGQITLHGLEMGGYFRRMVGVLGLSITRRTGFQNHRHYFGERDTQFGKFTFLENVPYQI